MKLKAECECSINFYAVAILVPLVLASWRHPSADACLELHCYADRKRVAHVWAHDLHAHRQRRPGHAKQVRDHVPFVVQADRRDGRGEAETIKKPRVDRIARSQVLDSMQRWARRVRREQYDGAVAVVLKETPKSSLERVHPPRQALPLLWKRLFLGRPEVNYASHTCIMKRIAFVAINLQYNTIQNQFMPCMSIIGEGA